MNAAAKRPTPDLTATPLSLKTLTRSMPELGDRLLKMKPQRPSASSASTRLRAQAFMRSVWSMCVWIVTSRGLAGSPSRHGLARDAQAHFDLRADGHVVHVRPERVAQEGVELVLAVVADGFAQQAGADAEFDLVHDGDLQRPTGIGLEFYRIPTAFFPSLATQAVVVRSAVIKGTSRDTASPMNAAS